MLYCCVRCGDLRSPWVMERHDGSLGVCDDDDDDGGGCKTRVKNGGKIIIFQAPTGCLEPGLLSV